MVLMAAPTANHSFRWVSNIYISSQTCFLIYWRTYCLHPIWELGGGYRRMGRVVAWAGLYWFQLKSPIRRCSRIVRLSGSIWKQPRRITKVSKLRQILFFFHACVPVRPWQQHSFNILTWITTTATKQEENYLEDELTSDEECYGRRCIANEHCCPGTVCVNVDGIIGNCLFAYGRKLGELCRRDADCESGLVCDVSVSSSASVCRAPVALAKQYAEDCNTSSDCDISRGLCCQLQRRHRQAPRKVNNHSCFYAN